MKPTIFTILFLAVSAPLALAKDRHSTNPSCGAPFCGRAVAEVRGIMDMLKERATKVKTNTVAVADGAEENRK
ncbi:hypothetical protein DDE82_007489 [Stemphylium lycopersici]|uniref:Uncharacterized protein n=1 Tax=Stemphylium lycopersici TaxID=183478 RepID=A0A364N800_STELY|nr:hypothetical protein TW65_07321 [Stemphylium lycopersici]RAR00247.1 hypothetical protein DDE82_007489 [Stemphylium lycopersici]RAR13410.1 hypothetical protein DDE83_003274 [Stemphylium lycopersici]